MKLFLVLFISFSVYAEKPLNFIIFLADAMGYSDLGSYGAEIHTPHLDKLANEGLRFTDFYSAAPNCSPARAGLLTGRTPSRVGVYDWVPPGGPMHLSTNELTIAELLKENNYQTAHMGKWHLSRWVHEKEEDGTSKGRMIGPTPDEQGFDYWFACDNNALPSHLNPVNFMRNGVELGKLEGYAYQLVADESIEWLREKCEEEKPFFLNIWFNEPHKFLASPPEMMEKYIVCTC